ncbi:TPA: hypothetical protein EYP38_04215, partial [Candidatus Micrarchaeota archaeon]|nr:hypothetical protein [Candidatus Micrarchaeota archaeon]
MLILVGNVYPQPANTSTEGGNISEADLTADGIPRWAAIVGRLNGTVVDPRLPVSWQNASNATVFPNDPNGSYAYFFNTTLMITRMGTKPELADISSPVASDFNESGMFSPFSVFASLNFSAAVDSPSRTFCDPACNYMTCYLYRTPFLCPFITLNPATRMGVLKFDNGTHEEAVFVGSIVSLLGYNGTFFDFEHMVPAFEEYFFYLYKEEDCNITVWIDGVPTTTFPQSGVPYGVEVLVTDNFSLPIADVTISAAEANGRNILYPILNLGREFLGLGYQQTDANGRAVFALQPSRYNIPDSYGYMPYLEVSSGGYYCRENLSIAQYSSLTPTYRTSLINSTYESQVKASSQNMNSLASTASKWVTLRKMRVANVTVYTNGTVLGGALPQLKAGAPNMLNITVINHTTLAVQNATANVIESNGHVVFVPQQPYKDGYNNTDMFLTNETPMFIPTRYNTEANFSIMLTSPGGTAPFTQLMFTVDNVLEPPTAGE